MNVQRAKGSAFTPTQKAKEPDLGTAPIPADRYTSADFMTKEWEGIWTKVWLNGGLVSDIPEPGNYICTDIGMESILLVRGQDLVIRAFYNVCQHRGNLIRSPGLGHTKSFKCQYHHWEWSLDGQVKHIPDASDFPQGAPDEKLGLAELACDTWGGFVWFNMDPDCEPLLDYLGIIPSHLDAYHFEDMVCTLDATAAWDCNWKTAVDAFNETYHVQGIHPQLMWSIDDVNIQLDLYEQHSRYLVPFGRLSPRINLEDPTQIPGPIQEMMVAAGMDPYTYEGDVSTVRRDIQQHKRAYGSQQGYDYTDMNDDQLTDDYHYFAFPNVTMNIHSESLMLFIHRPHETDPDKMYFDIKKFETVPAGTEPPVRPAHTVSVHGEDTLGIVVDQDAFNLPRVQRGMHSRGFKWGLWLTHQERRIRHFHKTISDYICE